MIWQYDFPSEMIGIPGLINPQTYETSNSEKNSFLIKTRGYLG
jgi:hypothetical protein